jgi:hypothetical protein
VDDGRTKEMRQVGKSAGTAAAATKGVDASRTGVAGRQVEPNGTQAVKADSATAAGDGRTKPATTTSADKKLPAPSAGTPHVDATKRGPARDGMGAGIGLGAVVAVAGGAGAVTSAAGVGAEADEAGKKDVNEPAQVVVVPPSAGTTERVPQEVPPIEEVSVFEYLPKLGLALTKLSNRPYCLRPKVSRPLPFNHLDQEVASSHLTTMQVKPLHPARTPPRSPPTC